MLKCQGEWIQAVLSKNLKKYIYFTHYFIYEMDPSIKPTLTTYLLTYSFLDAMETMTNLPQSLYNL